MSRSSITLFVLLLLAVVGLGIYAYADRGSPDAAPVPVASADRDAQELFQTNCGVCHTLAAAGSNGTVGPNLDELLVPVVTNPPANATEEEIAEQNKSSFEASYGRVLNAVTCGVAGRMPKGILAGSLAREVSGFTAAYAGQLSPGAGPLLEASERDLDAEIDCEPLPADAETVEQPS